MAAIFEIVFRHNSAKNRPISANFCYMKHNSMPQKVM